MDRQRGEITWVMLDGKERNDPTRGKLPGPLQNATIGSCLSVIAHC